MRRWKERVIPIVTGVIGTLLGYCFCYLASFQTEVTFKIRPTLAELNVWEALFSGHFFEWFWKLYSSILIIPFIILFTVIGASIGILIVRHWM